MGRPKILVIDAEPSIQFAVREGLAGSGADVVTVADADHAVEALRAADAGVVVADLRVLGGDPAGWIARATRLRPPLVVILLERADGGPRTPIAGAFDLLDRPPAAAALRRAGARALAHHRLLLRLHAVDGGLRGGALFTGFVGGSVAAERLRERIRTLARTADAVLFRGEPGSGRETAARTLHQGSSRAGGPFVRIDLSALSLADLASSEILHAAEGGTVYFEGLEGFGLGPQKTLCDLLERATDVRLTAGTSSNLARAVADDRFRSDLFTRLAAAEVRVPPLRDRREDIAALAHHLVDTIREINSLDAIAIAPETSAILTAYPWPGNVRELRHAVEHAMTTCEGAVIRPVDLPEIVRGGGGSSLAAGVSAADRQFREAKRDVVDNFEQAYLEDLLRRHHGNVTAAASHSGMLRSALQRLLRKHDLHSSEFRLETSSGTRERDS